MTNNRYLFYEKHVGIKIVETHLSVVKAPAVGNNTNLIRTTDRQLGVARVAKRYKPLVQRRGRE